MLACRQMVIDGRGGRGCCGRGLVESVSVRRNRVADGLRFQQRQRQRSNAGLCVCGGRGQATGARWMESEGDVVRRCRRAEGGRE